MCYSKVNLSFIKFNKMFVFELIYYDNCFILGRFIVFTYKHSHEYKVRLGTY